MKRLLVPHRNLTRFSASTKTTSKRSCQSPRFIHSNIPPTPSESSAPATPIVNDTAVSDGGVKTDEKVLESLLRAPFQKQVGRQPGILFPWRHSKEPLPRLVPGTSEFDEQGLLLGGNLDTSNPKLDSIATAKFFLGVPWYQMIFFNYWKADLAESMTWAFSQGTAALLSHVYGIPFEKISANDLELRFDHSLGTGEDDPPQPNGQKDDAPILEVTELMEGQLLGLFESSREFGKDTLQVRLEIKPSPEPAYIASLFVFPFLSRSTVAKHPSYVRRYQRMLNLLASNKTSDGLAIIQEFVEEFQGRQVAEHTVICQVMVPCEEVFCVRDSSTGLVVQGHEDEKFRPVFHLVRFEKVVTTHLLNNGRGIFPFRQEQGNWQITDIDDLLGGNLIL